VQRQPNLTGGVCKRAISTWAKVQLHRRARLASDVRS
jgi:hypothetical protein